MKKTTLFWGAPKPLHCFFKFYNIQKEVLSFKENRLERISIDENYIREEMNGSSIDSQKKERMDYHEKILFIIVTMFSFSLTLLSRGVGGFYVE
jgi:hypothetical protein